MAKKDDFDKIDANKDGFISREEYDNATETAGVEKEKLNWFLRLITLGDRFDIKDFWDRVKKSAVEFIILVFGVTVSFGIEQQGGVSDNRNDGIENLEDLREEIDKMIIYTDQYIETVDWVTELYQKQYNRWDKDNDSVFIDFQEDDEEPDGKYHFSPMGMYTNRDPFNPPRVNFDAIKLDGTFRLMPKEVGLMMTANSFSYLSKGLSMVCLCPKLSLRPSTSNSRTITSILSPKVKTSEGCFTFLVKDRSEI